MPTMPADARPLDAMDDAKALSALLALSEQALQAAWRSARSHAGGRNAKGDAVRAFDMAAHEAIAAFLRQRQLPWLLLSEEGAHESHDVGMEAVCTARLVVDPVDGSDNFAAGAPLDGLSSFCAALLPADGALDFRQVRQAIIRPLAGGPAASDCAFVLDENAAWQVQVDDAGASAARQQRLCTSDARCLQEAMITVELNHHAPSAALAGVMQQARGVRCFGCCSAALLAIARGQTDAHIDLRGRLTAESWLAAAALLQAAGGAVMLIDEHLQPAAPPQTLLQRRGLLAAANEALMNDILNRLSQIHY